MPADGEPGRLAGPDAETQPKPEEPAPAADQGVARASGWTDWGGLLFLLAPLEELGLSDEIAAHPLLAGRPFRWSLHRLALALVPAADDDPAALAFAGLPPDAPPPSAPARSLEPGAPSPGLDAGRQPAAGTRRAPAGELTATTGPSPLTNGGSARPAGQMPARFAASPSSIEAPPWGIEPPPSPEEEELFAGFAARLAAAAADRLGEPGLAVAALVDRVCRRRAEVVADPGWFEVRLALDDVSTELRRARLDLDPGWLPSLGVVVRFVYG